MRPYSAAPTIASTWREDGDCPGDDRTLGERRAARGERTHRARSSAIVQRRGSRVRSRPSDGRQSSDAASRVTALATIRSPTMKLWTSPVGPSVGQRPSRLCVGIARFCTQRREPRSRRNVVTPKVPVVCGSCRAAAARCLAVRSGGRGLCRPAIRTRRSMIQRRHRVGSRTLTGLP